jgi:hypothetical protein
MFVFKFDRNIFPAIQEIGGYRFLLSHSWRPHSFFSASPRLCGLNSFGCCRATLTGYACGRGFQMSAENPYIRHSPARQLPI